MKAGIGRRKRLDKNNTAERCMQTETNKIGHR